MIISIPTRVRADVLPHRGRKTRKAFVDETMTFDVKETPADEAPVVLAVPDGVGGTHLIRFHEGLLWASAESNYEERGRNKIAFPAYLHGASLDGKEIGSSIAGRTAIPNARVVSNQRDLVASVTQEWIDGNWRVIDGLMHWRTGSPLVSFDEIADGYGDKVAMQQGLMPTSHVPAWFAPRIGGKSFRDHLRKFFPKNARMAMAISEMLDVEVLRPDLLEICRRREAENCLPDEMVKSLGRLVAANPTPHLSLPASPIATTQRRKLLKSTAFVAYDEAASTGASFADAARAAQAAVEPLPTEQNDPSRILLPASPDFLHTCFKHPVHFFEQRLKDNSVGWATTGMGSRTVRTDPVVLIQSQLTYVATIGANRYWTDSSGSFHVDPNHVASSPSTLARIGAGVRRLEEQGLVRKTDVRNLHNHAKDLAENAKGLTYRGKKPDVDEDHLGRSLRHEHGCLPFQTNYDRARIVEEFVFHRMSLVDDRIHLRCPEPAIAVHPDLDKSKVRPWISHAITIRTSPGVLPPFLFRLDQMTEALEVAGCRGPFDDSEVANLHLGDPALLTFDSDLWNLRAATKRILKDLDGRVRLMDGDTAAAIARLDKCVESWSLDTSLASSEEVVADLLIDAGLLLDALAHPLMDDIGEDWVREIARTSLKQALDARRAIDAQPSEEFAGFTM